MVKDIVLKSGSSNHGYRYSSWIREIQVYAIRNNLFEPKDNGLVISMARRVMVEVEVLRPDIAGAVIEENPGRTDILLNSLCQFDCLYCIWVYSKENHTGGAYPSFSMFYQSRVVPIFEQAISTGGMDSLFPGIEPTALADAMSEVFGHASRESFSTNSDWSGAPFVLKEFINLHKTANG